MYLNDPLFWSPFFHFFYSSKKAACLDISQNQSFECWPPVHWQAIYTMMVSPPMIGIPAKLLLKCTESLGMREKKLTSFVDCLMLVSQRQAYHHWCTLMAGLYKDPFFIHYCLVYVLYLQFHVSLINKLVAWTTIPILANLSYRPLKVVTFPFMVYNGIRKDHNLTGRYKCIIYRSICTSREGKRENTRGRKKHKIFQGFEFLKLNTIILNK